MSLYHAPKEICLMEIQKNMLTRMYWTLKEEIVENDIGISNVTFSKREIFFTS